MIDQTDVATAGAEESSRGLSMQPLVYPQDVHEGGQVRVERVHGFDSQPPLQESQQFEQDIVGRVQRCVGRDEVPPCLGNGPVRGVVGIEDGI